MKTIQPLARLHRVYCAGPLFNAAERAEMNQLAAHLLEAGFEPFVPHADGVEFAQVYPYLVSQGVDPTTAGHCMHKAIFALDVYQAAVGCGTLVFNMNGRTPDEGAVAELTIAWMLGKPLVIYKEDIRSMVAGRDNPIVIGQAGFESVSRMADVPTALRARIALLEHDDTWSVPCPPHLQATLAAGQRFWEELERLGSERPTAPLAEWMFEAFGPEATATR